jgi:hypothetical protein
MLLPELECLRCGNCCPEPPRCNDKQINSDGFVTCLNHPALNDGVDSRGFGCSFSTWKMWGSGVHCLAVEAYLLTNEPDSVTLSYDATKVIEGQTVRVYLDWEGNETTWWEKVG